MKIIRLLILLQLACIIVSAQKNDSRGLLQRETVNSLRETKDYSGFTIRLAPATNGSFGFDILNKQQFILRRIQNPAPFLPKGLQKKEDAYKLAQWIINEHTRTGHWQNMVPPHVLNQLKITSVN